MLGQGTTLLLEGGGGATELAQAQEDIGDPPGQGQAQDRRQRGAEIVRHGSQQSRLERVRSPRKGRLARRLGSTPGAVGKLRGDHGNEEQQHQPESLICASH